MGTSIRSEVSEKNQYRVEKHRYYDLKHFCLQYPIWKKEYLALDGLTGKPYDPVIFNKSNRFSDPTAKCAEVKEFYSNRIDMVEFVAEEANPELVSYILKAVTQGVSYDQLKARLNIPCCKDVYYKLYRRFFWLLSKERG